MDTPFKKRKIMPSSTVQKVLLIMVIIILGVLHQSFRSPTTQKPNKKGKMNISFIGPQFENNKDFFRGQYSVSHISLLAACDIAILTAKKNIVDEIEALISQGLETNIDQFGICDDNKINFQFTEKERKELVKHFYVVKDKHELLKNNINKCSVVVEGSRESVIHDIKTMFEKRIIDKNDEHSFYFFEDFWKNIEKQLSAE